MVAVFMRMYKGYTVRDVMDEYAITFSSLLEEGFRQEARDNLMKAHLAMAPEMKGEDWKNVVRDLKNASLSPDDILNTKSTPGAEEQLKQALK